MKKIQDYLKDLDSVVIGFSAGIDSSLLMELATETLGAENVLGITMDIGFQTREEVDRAKTLAKDRGWTIKLVQNPLEDLDDQVLNNPKDRCYYCKKTIFSYLKDLAHKEGYKAVCDGANVDDLGDIRPGMEATKELGIHSPFLVCGWGKEEIRKEAKRRGLPNWDLPSSACLASRVAYGQRIKEEDLEKIEAGEEWVRAQGFRQVRIRLKEKGPLLEVGQEDLKKAKAMEEDLVNHLENLGFIGLKLDPRGYRQGALNEEVTNGSTP